MHGSDQEARYGVLPQVEKAWNFPLFEAIVGRRSRRFGFGMELSHGPFSYKSDKDPVPLDEAETAMLVAAATGVTGAILCEGEFQGGMVKSVGRPHPSAVGSHRTELFFTNDDGVFLMVMPRILMGEGSLRKKHPLTHHRTWQHRVALSRKGPARGEGTVTSACARCTRPPDKQCAGSEDTRAQKIVTQ